MSQKLKLLFIFNLFALFNVNDGIHMNCSCGNTTIRIDGRQNRTVPTCLSTSFTDMQVTSMNSVFHSSIDQNFTLDMAEALLIEAGAASLSYIPSNISIFFPNLKTFSIAATSLRQISSTDLKQLPKLQTFISNGNLITSLPANLFEGNLEMTEFGVIGRNNYDRSNSLHTIGENLLINATKLEFAVFWNNFCVNDIAINRTQVINLNSRLHTYCSGGSVTSTQNPTSNSPPSTTQIPGVSSTTSNEISLLLHGASHFTHIVCMVILSSFYIFSNFN